MNELVFKKVIKGWFKPILSFSFLLLVLQVFSHKLSAQTVSLIPDLCGRSIQYCDEGIINIYAPNSKIVYSNILNLKSGLFHIDLSNYPSGVYVVEISDCYSNSNSLKIIKTE